MLIICQNIKLMQSFEEELTSIDVDWTIFVLKSFLKFNNDLLV